MRKRIIAWNLVWEMFHIMHRMYFSGRSFGTDLDIMFILGAVLITRLEDRVTNATKIAAYLEMPRETVRRKLQELVDMGLLICDSQKYLPGPKMGTFDHAPKMQAKIREAARALEELHESEIPKMGKRIGLPPVEW